MNLLYTVFLLIVLLLPVLVIFILILYLIRILITGGRDIEPFHAIKGPLPKSYKEALIRYFGYYQSLPLSSKAEFERRVHNFIENKEFIPMHGMTAVTSEMKALISGSAIQLTFGLDEVYFVHFHRILVFPRRFYNVFTKAKHKGEVNEAGVIAFSWEDFVKGYIDPGDTYNLGLHEMTHALSLENDIYNQEYHFLDRQKLANWKELADTEFEAIRNGKKTFLRKYAVSHRTEFFPVCVEHFFERPEEFRAQAPLLYKALSELLRQNPGALQTSRIKLHK